MSNKTVRYYYWLAVEFVKKNFRLIIVSFVLTFISLISFVSLSPYLESIFSNKKMVIGLVGKYDLNTVPDEVINKISNGLVFINEKGEVLPILANSWEVKNNGLTYRFHLKDNLLWSDGKRFTAENINYQFKDIELKVVDAKTIEFILTKPLAIFPTYLRRPIVKYPLIGVAGPYKVAGIKSQFGYITELILDPNKKDIPPITYKFYDNETQLLTAYKKAEINEMNLTKKTVADTFSHWKNTRITKSVDYTRLMTLFFNFSRPFLKQKEPAEQKNIKDGIWMAIDPQLFKDWGEGARGPIPPTSWAYNPNLKTNIFSAEGAEKIIRKNFEASQSAELNLVTYYDYYDIADEIVSSLKKVGLSVNLNIISYDKPSNFDFLLAFWKVPPDPDQYYFWHSTQTQGNIGNYANVKVDKLLEDGRRTSLNAAERKKIYFDFQKIIADDPPAVFLYYPYVYTVKRK